MWYNLETTRYQDIDALRKRRDSLHEKSSKLSEELKLITPELEKRTSQLRTLRKDLAAIEKDIKDKQNKISLLFRKRAEMEQRSVFFQKELKEIQAIEAERTKLRDASDALRTDIENTERDIRAISESIADFETEKKEMSSQVAQQEAERDSLSNEISKIMENTSLNREKTEAELNDLSVDFVRKVGERDTLKERLSATERAIEPINESIAELEQKIQFLEEVKNLHAQRNTLRAGVEKQEKASLLVTAKIKELRESLSDRQKQHDVLSTENAERKKEMISLEEQVVVYEEAFTAAHAAQKKWNSSFELAERRTEGLIENLGEKTRLEEELRMVMEKNHRLVQTFSSLSQPE
jgi:chromosome segregation ATPase